MCDTVVTRVNDITNNIEITLSDSIEVEDIQNY
jgi:hypothetical protein